MCPVGETKSGTFCDDMIRLHRMHKMLTIATDDLVAWCACKSVTRPTKMTERIKVLFGVKIIGRPKNSVL